MQYWASLDSRGLSRLPAAGAGSADATRMATRAVASLLDMVTSPWGRTHIAFADEIGRDGVYSPDVLKRIRVVSFAQVTQPTPMASRLFDPAGDHGRLS